MKQDRYWIGQVPAECNVCRLSTLASREFFDARIPGNGWGNICRECFFELGCSLGTGRGQHYEQQADSKWLKVEG